MLFCSISGKDPGDAPVLLGEKEMGPETEHLLEKRFPAGKMENEPPEPVTKASHSARRAAS